MRSVRLLIGTALAVAVAGPSQAAIIDFESFVDGQPLGSVVVPGNVVTFEVGAGSSPSETDGTGFVAEVGSPTTAFSPEDTPTGSGSGDFFLTTGGFASMTPMNYFITFDNAVDDLSMDVYDLVTDAKATLTVFSNPDFTNPVGFEEHVQTAVVDFNIAVLDASAPIRSASLIFTAGSFGSDFGTGIDNVTFAMPEPAVAVLVGIGLSWVACLRTRRRLL